QRDKYGTLARGVKIGEGGTLRVFVPDRRPELKIALNPASGDHAILQTAIEIRDAAPDRPTIFVTMDVNLRIRADALGLVTESYENQAVDIDHLETGVVEVAVRAQDLDKYFESGMLEAPSGAELYANLCVLLRDDSPKPRTALGRFHADKSAVCQLRASRERISGVRPCNKEQNFAFDLLLDDS